MSQFGGILVEPTVQPQPSGGSRFGGIPVDVQPTEPTTKTESALMGAADIGSFGLADEAQAALGAGLLKGLDVIGLSPESVRGKSYGEMYSAGQKALDTANKQAFEENPVSYVAGGLGAGLLTGAAAGATKAGSAIGNSLRSGEILGKNIGTLGRVIKGAAAGATSGALYGATGAEQGQRLEGAKQGAIYGGVAGGAVPALGAAVKGAFTKSAPNITSDKIGKLASQAYRTAEQKGGVLTPQFTDKFVAEIDKFTPQTSAGKLLAGDSPVTKITEKIAGLRGQPLTLQAAQEVDEFLGDAIDGFTEMGRLTKQGKKLLDIQSSFRNMIDSAGVGDVVGKEGFDSLKEGRRLWSGAARLRDIEKIITRAELSDQPATAIKSGFRTLLSNPARLKGFSESERKLIRKAAETGVVADTLRVAGSRLIPIIAGSTGGLGAAAVGQAASMAARGGATKLQVGRAGKIAQEVAKNAMGGAKSLPQLPASRITPTIGLAGSGAAGSVAGAEARSAMPMAKTPPVTLPNATQPSTMDVVPFEQLMPEAQPNTGTVQPLTPEPFNPSPQSSIEGVIGEAAQIGGANPDLLQAIAETESSLNPQAKASTSSASGLFQITKDTWRNLVAKYGKETGIAMKDIMNPRANAIMAAYLTKENADKVSKALGRGITAGESYIAHFMGAAGATKLLQADDNKLAWKLFPQAAKANKSIFFAGKTPRTVGELKSILANKVESKIAAKEQQKQQEQQQQPLPQEQMPQEPDIQLANIPYGAIQELKRKPQSAMQFDEIFGAGTAKKILNT